MSTLLCRPRSQLITATASWLVASKQRSKVVSYYIGNWAAGAAVQCCLATARPATTPPSTGHSILASSVIRYKIRLDRQERDIGMYHSSIVDSR